MSERDTYSEFPTTSSRNLTRWLATNSSKSPMTDLMILLKRIHGFGERTEQLYPNLHSFQNTDSLGSRPSGRFS